MRFGVCTGIENIGVLEAAGYDYIELSVAGHLAPEKPDSEVMPALEAAFAGSTIKPEAYNGFLPGDLRVTGPVIDKARQEAYAEVACRRVAQLGGDTIVFGSGGARRVPEGFDKNEAYDQITEFLKRIAPIAARHGVTIVIEPLCAGECNILNGVAESMEIVERVGESSIQVLSDLYHVATDEQSYRETADAGEHLRHVHVATKEGRRAPVTADTEFITDYFRSVLAAGYDGRVSVEGAWTSVADQAAEVLATLKAARTAAE
ncbi:MAG TPA: sugar phosphate isomerase/epimerase family protein [Capsulimonadaceae bacterium]|jgi:sugar phosphate isomerase/epimerase